MVSSARPQACREKHVAAEDFLVYGAVWEGVIECSNTLEDADDPDLSPQALVYKPCRRLIYGLLLLNGDDGGMSNLPAGTAARVHKRIVSFL